MTDDGLEPVEVTGGGSGSTATDQNTLECSRWSQKSARLVTEITGEMYDQITDVSDLLERLVEAFQEDITQGGGGSWRK